MRVIIFAIAALVHAGPLIAQVATEAPAPAPGQVATTETADFSDAEVRRVDRDAQKITLRQLLNLDKLKDVPDTWPGQNYDYFWIVEFGNPASDVPTKFNAVKQTFQAPFDKVPANDWGKRAKMPLGNKCLP